MKGWRPPAPRKRRLPLGSVRAGFLAVLLLAASCGGPPAKLPFAPVQKSVRTDFAGKDVLREFEAGADEVYRIGQGDQLTVTVWGRPELSGAHTVGPDGRITVPLAGSVKVDLLTRDEADATVAAALRRFYVEPAVTVRVDQYVSNRILLLGRVGNPGIVRFETTPTLLEALARAGALPVLDKQATLTRCAIFRGRDRIIWVDVKRLLASNADLAYNIRLRSNDLVYIPDSFDTLVYVLGEVQRPGAYRLTPDMSLLDALAQAGGPTKDAAPERMRVIRPSSGVEKEVPFSTLIAPGTASNYALEEGDVIWLPQSGLAKLGYVLQQLNPLTSFIVVGGAVGK